MTMVTIVRYSTRAGPDNQKILRLGTNSVQLKRHGVTEIDLSGIENLENLQRLDIGDNRLKKLDLEPLKVCKELRYLDLSGNSLKKLDLKPLSHCTKLRRLDLSHNKFKHLDLLPISRCTDIKEIYIHGNLISNLNVTPLLDCSDIEQITIEKNANLFLGYTIENQRKIVYHSDPFLEYALQNKRPKWIHHEQLKSRHKLHPYKVLVKEYGWCTIKNWMKRISVMMGKEHTFKLQSLLLQELGMPELACYDGPVSEIIDMLPNTGGYRKGKTTIRKKMIQNLMKQLDSGGSTLFFDIDALALGDASVLIPNLLEGRKEEVRNLRLTKRGNYVDLSPLWTTGYGYEILKAMNVGRRASIEVWKEIVDRFASIDVELQLNKTPLKVSKKNVSEILSQHVVPPRRKRS